MKLLAVVGEHAKRPVVYLGSRDEAVFFAGAQPAVGALIAIEMSRLRGVTGGRSGPG